MYKADGGIWSILSGLDCTTIYADPTTAWGYEISFAYHESIVEHEAKPGARQTPPKGGQLTWRVYLTRNLTSGSDPRSRQHLLPHKTGNPAVCEQLCLGGLSNHLPRNLDNAAHDPTQSVTGTGHGKEFKPLKPIVKESAMDKSGSSWGSTAYSTTKLTINVVKEVADAFPPLKAVAGGLSVILDHCDVQYISHITPPMELTSIPANVSMPQNNKIIGASG